MNMGETAAILSRITELEHSLRVLQTTVDELRTLIPAASLSPIVPADPDAFAATSAQSNLPPSVAKGGRYAARA